MTIGPMRSGPTGDSSLNYAAIGATQSEEILAYPPPGYKAFQATQKLGSGDERFETATRELMTWGLQRNAGITVTDITPESDDTAYTGIEFGEDGRAVGPAAPAEEELFAPDGTPYVSAGMTAVMHLAFGPVRIPGPVKVVYVIDEPKRIGYAYGTRLGHPSEAEQLMVVDQHDDGEVWLTIRSISRASHWKWRIPLAAFRLGQKRYTRRFLTALHPTRTGG